MNTHASAASATEVVQQGLSKRYNAESRFKLYGIVGISIAMVFLFILMFSILSTGLPAFSKSKILLPFYMDPEVINVEELADPAAARKINLRKIVNDSKAAFFGATERADKRQLEEVVSTLAQLEVLEYIRANPQDVGETVELWVTADDEAGRWYKGEVDETLPENRRPLNDQQIGWLKRLTAEERVKTTFNDTFFQGGDSRNPEQAGILAALKGSFLTLIVTLGLSFPIGVAAAVYLEEFAPKNRFTDIVEVNINNLAAVPSIIFGLLGLAVFLNIFGMPRSAPVVGGLVLTLMTLPTIIISSRAALRAVPPSIKDAALGLGASPMQTVFHHVVPLALPGMLTGTIIGLAQALGETAPLLMIGMVAFIVDVPQGFTDASSVLPVQIYLWSDSAERAFVEKTSGGIIVLLMFLIAMNAMAVLLRKKFERRW